MGTKIVDFYRSKISYVQKVAFFSTFIIAFFTHIYKFTNTLPYHDSLYIFYSSQSNALYLGRWALPAVCGISSFYDLPWLNGLLAIIYIALTVVVIVTLFRVKNSFVAVLIGGILATSVTTTTTFYYEFTADGYMFAMFLAVIAVWLTRLEEKHIWCYITAIVCLCVSCGIYQAYFSFALVLVMCYYLYELLNVKRTKKQMLIWACKQIGVYATSIGLYYVIWKIILFFNAGEIKDYQGISNAGFNLGYLKNGLKQTILTIYDYLFPLNGFVHGVSLYSVLNLAFVVLFAVILIVALIKQKLFQQKVKMCLYFLSLLVMPIAICVWHFTSDNVQYYSLMLQGVYLLFILAILLVEKYGPSVLKKTACVYFVVFLFSNVVMSNIGYYYLHMCYERTYAEGVSMMVEMQEHLDEEKYKVAFVGNRSNQATLPVIDSATGKMTECGRVYHLIRYTSATLLFDAEHIRLFLTKMFGMDMELASKEEMETITCTDTYNSMPVWPKKGSIQTIEGILIVKLS